MSAVTPKAIARQKTYRCWYAMRRRCTNPNVKEYSRYGGRGIKVCPQWAAFSVFLRDMGLRPHGMHLDRIDNDGPYVPENCRWATPMQNMNNRGNVNVYVINGELLTIREMCARTGLKYHTISKRIAAGKIGAELMALVKSFRDRKNVGTSNGMSKLNETDLERIRDMRRIGVQQIPIAMLFQISKDYVGLIARRARRA